MGFFARIRAAIDGEFERRLRRASGLEAAAPHAPPARPEADDDGGAEIVNIPRGAAAPAPPEADDDGGAEIVNIPRGAGRG